MNRKDYLIRPSYEQWAEDLNSLETNELRIHFIRTTLQHKENLHFFGKYFFPHIIKGDYKTNEAHLDLINELTKQKHSAIIFPRGFAKSTWEKVDTMHDIVYAIEPVIMYVSAALQDAQFHFESMKLELETNEKLRFVYGDLMPDLQKASVKWTNNHFETSNGVNVVARGAGKGRGVNIRNQRPTKIIIDDGETDEQVRSKQRRDQYHQWITQVIIPSLDKERGRLKMVGTVIHPHTEIKKFYDGYGGIFRRAIEDGKSIWPEMWSLEDLERLRDGYTDAEGVQHVGIGLRAFSQEYLNEPINDVTSIFKQEWLDANTYENTPSQDELDRFFEIKMAVDPNAGLSQMADFMAICVMGRDKRTGKWWVLEARRMKKPINEQVNEIRTSFEWWKPQIIGVEKVLNQTALYQLLLSKNEFPVLAISPEGKDKVNRAYILQPFVEQGSILFNPSHKELYNELMEFPNGQWDDMADSLMYACSLFSNNMLNLNQAKAPMMSAGLMNKKF